MQRDLPVFYEEGFMLRPIVSSDINNIYLGLSNPDVIKYYGVSYASLPETQAQMEWFETLEHTGTGIWWAIIDLHSTNFFGAIGFNNLSTVHQKAELGFWLFPNFWGLGIMTKTAARVCDFGFKEMNLHRIEALVETENYSSQKLLSKLGFTCEGTLVDYEVKNGNFISINSYAKLYQSS